MEMPPPETGVPLSTYRLQLNASFTLRQAISLVDYFHDLGVGDLYLSPLFKARPGSPHGYDLTDHGEVNPEVGTEGELGELAGVLQERGMGILLDVVPNHMGINDPSNRWWMDVLENGPSSPHARSFDIDWHPPKAELEEKVLLPVLGEQYGRALENGEIQARVEGGGFHLEYGGLRFPVTPRSAAAVLGPARGKVRARLGESHPHFLELESILTGLDHLPPRTETYPDRIRERLREKEILKKRLAALLEESGETRRAVEEALEELNGRPGDPRSFDRLEELASSQAYRLCYWRVASDEINYRRFFDINDLAAIRVETPQVFEAVHQLPFLWLSRGWVRGLRIDHPDGLHDPEQYFQDLARRGREAMARHGGNGWERGPGAPLPFYVVAEKVLAAGERLRPEWAVHGTTGYDALNLLNGVFVQSASEQLFRDLYQRFAGPVPTFPDLLYASKRLILDSSMAGEIHVLACALDRISEQHRWSRDFTLQALRVALREVIASFSVYRSYIRKSPCHVHPPDRQVVEAALREARRRNWATEASVFDFLRSVLFKQDPQGLTPEQVEDRREFVMRFQQLTGPVTAKGLEDTAFYRHYPLASLNEVGGTPQRFGVTVEEFHRRSLERLVDWPYTLVATSTHDTKRGEDVRARLNVLSEAPTVWYRAIRRWQAWNRQHKVLVDGREVPDDNEEYLLYQTLVGAWPLQAPDPRAHQGFVKRIQEYMQKAIKEAKVHTSWINPDPAYDEAMEKFVGTVLAGGKENRFLQNLVRFQRPVALAGMMNSLSQILLKTAGPGIPDFYQGTETWSLTLVDPDNRGAVDHGTLQESLASLRAEQARGAEALVEKLLRRLHDGRLKMYVVRSLLHFRRAHPELFLKGSYLPLEAEGKIGDHVISFARSWRKERVIACAGRFFFTLARGRLPVGAEVWGNGRLLLPREPGEGKYREILTGRILRPSLAGNRAGLALAEVFARLPVALLERTG